MNFSQLLAFYEVARQRNFTRAAKNLAISQPAVTRRILEMERAHNVKLLERTSRNVVLTGPGKMLMSYVERMVALLDEAEISLKSTVELKTGRIEIGASRPVASAYLSAISVAFKKRFPGVIPVIHVENSHWIFEQIVAFRLDLGIIGMKPNHPDLIVSPFFDEALVLVVSPTHPWATRKSFKLEELTGQSLVMREKGSGTRELIESALDRSKAKPIIAMEIGSNEAIKRAVEGNIGLAFFPPSVVDAEVKKGEMKALKIRDARLGLSFNVIYHQEKRSSPLIRAFMEVLNEQRPTPTPYGPKVGGG